MEFKHTDSMKQDEQSARITGCDSNAFISNPNGDHKAAADSLLATPIEAEMEST